MTRLARRLRTIHDELPFWQRLTTERARDALAAALLHDVGHGPFSHLFEDALPDAPTHEDWTTRIVLDESTEVHAVLAQQDPSLPARVAELVLGRHQLTYLARAVSGTFDVDRCDYLLRDAHFSGVTYGSYDLDGCSTVCASVTEHTAGCAALAIDGAKACPRSSRSCSHSLHVSAGVLPQVEPLERVDAVAIFFARARSSPMDLACRMSGSAGFDRARRRRGLGSTSSLTTPFSGTAISSWREAPIRC